MKTILITGGSGKVGFQLVNHFLKQNFLVVTTTRDRTSFYEKKRGHLHKAYEDNLKVLEVDFNQKHAAEVVFNFLKKENVALETVVHNARSLDFIEMEEDGSVTEENFAGEFFMDVIFPYRLNLELLKIPNRLSNIIFISSMYGVVAPTPSLYENFKSSSAIHYGVSKAAQIHLTKELAVRLSPEVRVNCVSFGGIKGRADKNFVARYSKLNPQGKMLHEEDVIGPIDFLVSEKSANMNGQNIIIDGGWTIW